MDWNNEYEFVEDFIKLFISFKVGNKENIKILREVRTGYGRPDIAVIEYNPKITERRLKATNDVQNKEMTVKSAYAMSYLTNRRWVKKDKLSEFLNCKGYEFNNVVKELEIRKLIDIKENLIKAKPRREILAVSRLLSYEAKLNQWKEAVDQAERNLWFTNESYVLMPMKSSNIVNTLTGECSRRGVGLGFLEKNSCYREIIKPKCSKVINSPLLWILNERILEEYDE